MMDQESSVSATGVSSMLSDSLVTLEECQFDSSLRFMFGVAKVNVPNPRDMCERSVSL